VVELDDAGRLAEHERTTTLIELDYVTGSHPVYVAGRCGGSGGAPHAARVGLRAVLAHIADRYGRAGR
jgi:hypothetical protein